MPITSDAITSIECGLWDKLESNDVTIFIGQVISTKADPKYFDPKTGWNIKNNPISLHNWRKFFKIGQLMMVSEIRYS